MSIKPRPSQQSNVQPLDPDSSISPKPFKVSMVLKCDMLFAVKMHESLGLKSYIMPTLQDCINAVGSS